MSMTKDLLEKLRVSGVAAAQEARVLYETAPLEELCAASHELTLARCGNTFDLCSIVNGRDGACTENCRFCAQSCFMGGTGEFIDDEAIIAAARWNAERGVRRFSIVTSGRKLSSAEVEHMACVFERLVSEVDIELCGSFGLLTYDEFVRLRAAGMTRAHNNLETSRRFFPSICTSHTYDDKIASLKAAKRAGLSLCSGGIFGLGETPADRIDMLITLRELGVRSIPLNTLNPLPGTPLGSRVPLSPQEVLRSVAVARFVTPDAHLRLAGGRELLPDTGEACLQAGANAVITGDMLTTKGISPQTDCAMIERNGYVVNLCE